MNHTSRLPIVLCCAEESEVALVAVVDALHREGFAPEVLPGVETDTTLLTAAADRVRGPALFVLCGSEDLDRFQVRRLEGLFSARKGPEHRMITVDVPRRHALALVETVRAAARELGGGARPADHDDGHYMRDVVMPTSVAAVPGATVPGKGASGRASAFVARAPDGISDAALGLGGDTDTEVVDPQDFRRRPAVPEPDVVVSDPLGREPGDDGAPFDAAPGDGVPLAVPEDFPVVGESSQDLEIIGAPKRVPWDKSGPVEVERVARAPRADPRAETDDTPLPSASSPIAITTPPPEREPAEPPRRGARVLLLLIAAAGMAGVVTMAVLHATAPTGVEPGRAMHERGVPSERSAGAEGAGAEGDAAGPQAEGDGPAADGAVASDAGSTAADGAAPLGAGSTGGAEAGATGSGDEPTGGEGAPTHDTGASDETSGPAAVTDGMEGSDDGAGTADDGDADPEPDADGSSAAKTVPPPPTADPSRSQVDAAVEAALADGRLQALDELLVLSTGPGTITWDEAADRCKRRKLDGLRGWRLPSKAQLARLRKHGVIASGTYWSSSQVGGDEVYVLDATTGAMHQYLKIEPNARALCVRRRP